MAIKLHQILTNITMIIANNIQETCDQASEITAQPIVDALKRAICTNLEHLYRWFHGSRPYLDPDYVQQKWNQMDAEYNLTNTVGDIFPQILLAVKNLFGHMIHSFDKVLPPETLEANYVPQKWKQMDAEYNLTNTVGDIFPQILLAVKSFFGHLIHSFDKVLPPETLEANYVPQKWKQMDAEYNLTNTVGDIFTLFLSAVENFSGYFIRSFDKVLPSSETREEQIHHWIYAAARFLIPVIVLIISVHCFIYVCAFVGIIFSCLFMFISSIVGFLFMFIFSIVRFLFMFISFIVGFLFWCNFCIVKICFYPFRPIFWFLKHCLWRISSIVKCCFYPFHTIFWILKQCLCFPFFIVKSCYVPFCSVFRFVKQCLCFGGKSVVKMMKAPGRPTMMIARAAFEANPQGYFTNLRGKC